MSNTVRLIVALVLTGALAALATPELAAKLPPGTSTILAAAIAAVLHKMNAEAAQMQPPAKE
jgi:hypothetical protein